MYKKKKRRLDRFKMFKTKGCDCTWTRIYCMVKHLYEAFKNFTGERLRCTLKNKK